MDTNYEELFRNLVKRYGDVDPQAIESILCPILIPIHNLDKTIVKLAGQGHYRASFSIAINEESHQIMQRGRTGKFVPREYVNGGAWKEIAKGRIIEVDHEQGTATGEVYVGGSKTGLEEALVELSDEDFLEIDQYGAASSVLSALVEYSVAEIAREEGYEARRMPADTAQHIGAYYHYDYELQRDGVVKKVEVKSLWGTNTRYARLIHSKGRDYPTSSIKFATQDIVAVSLFLRTGNIRDFAFARSVPKDVVNPHGLPRASKFPDHAHQNPLCEIGDGTWFGSIAEVWDLD